MFVVWVAVSVWYALEYVLEYVLQRVLHCVFHHALQRYVSWLEWRRHCVDEYALHYVMQYVLLYAFQFVFQYVCSMCCSGTLARCNSGITAKVCCSVSLHIHIFKMHKAVCVGHNMNIIYVCSY